MTTKEQKASPVLMELIRKEIARLIEMGAQDANLPAGASLDITRGVWMVPVPETPAA
jgi:hypothetical protein